MPEHPVFNALAPVILMVSAGWLAARLRLIGAGSTRDLTNLVFLVLMPAMLFRAMSRVHLGELELRPIAIYFGVCFVLFFGVIAVRGWTREGAVLGLAAIFSNSAMLGLPIARLVYGEAGLVLMVTLVSLHSLVLLTVVTIALELAVLREKPADGGPSPAAGRGVPRTVLMAVRNALIHPIPMPIILGLLYAQTGWTIPAPVDRSLELMGAAFPPVALVMVGVTLAHTRVGEQALAATRLALLKLLVHPVLMFGAGWLLGLRGLPLAVMTLAAAMPMGANVFLFSQRYRVAEPLVIAAVGVSTGVALLTVTLTLALLGWFKP